MVAAPVSFYTKTFIQFNHKPNSCVITFIAIIAKIENQQVKYPKRVSLSDANLCFIFYNW
jgi:hypothetical protein